jgi:hypothetical protein
MGDRRSQFAPVGGSVKPSFVSDAVFSSGIPDDTAGTAVKKYKHPVDSSGLRLDGRKADEFRHICA